MVSVVCTRRPAPLIKVSVFTTQHTSRSFLFLLSRPTATGFTAASARVAATCSAAPPTGPPPRGANGQVRCPLRVGAVAPDSSQQLAGACDGTVAPCDLRSRTLRSAVSEASVVACCLSPCGQMFVTGCTHGDLKLWDTDINLLHAEKDTHDLGVTCCSFAPKFEVDGCRVEFRLASCGQDSQLKIWIVSQREVQNLGTLLNSLKEHDRYVTAVALSPTMPWIAAGSMDRTVKVWKIGDGVSRTGRKLPGHSRLLVC
ncbi:hypothetical protein FQN60_001389 [Etheostoma spectabile]|uniref:Uncharacterized protein n=1 Tax=Etheostoma spectabile TaxID=54343 RepID=A0A5J5D6J6_9PERO|nr:hypothetical protein FQN60_001389 [Etheostoma spectabile]